MKVKLKHRLLLFFIFTAFTLGNCNLPRVTIALDETSTPVPIIPTDTASPPPAAELGLIENPLILALPPSANSPEQINAAKEIAAQFTQRTGYVVVTVIADSYPALIDALEKGNAHIALLDPVSYALTHQKDLIRAHFAVIKDGNYKYGAQFLASRKSGFTSYFNPVTGENTADAGIALAQFSGKKPCWSDQKSPSGYLVPLGMLNQNQVFTQPAAFMGGQHTVVRSLYAGGICDFGATYIDARKFPSLEDEMPDLVEQVSIIWRIPELIPHEVIAFSRSMPPSMQALFDSAIPAVMQTDSGKAAFKTAYDIDELQAINDGDFKDFLTYMKESRIDLTMVINDR